MAINVDDYIVSLKDQTGSLTQLDHAIHERLFETLTPSKSRQFHLTRGDK